MKAFRILLVTLIIGGIAHANTDTPKKIKNDFNFFGYIDGSYNYLLQSNQFISKSFNRANDVDENGFTLQQIYLKASYLPDLGMGGLFNLIVGRDTNYFAPLGLNPQILGSEMLGVLPGEAI